MSQFSFTKSAFFVALAILLKTAVLPAQTHAAESSMATQQELKQVAAAIEKIEAWLNQARAERPTYENNLRDTENSLRQIQQTIADSENAIAELSDEVQQLQTEITALEILGNEQKILAMQSLRQAYMTGQQSILKLLLHQEQTRIATRMVHYYEQVSRSRLTQLLQYQQTLNQLSNAADALTLKDSLLATQRGRLDTQRESLETTRLAHQRALAAFDTEMMQRSNELESLREDRDNLEALLVEIAEAMETVPALPESIPMAQQKQQLAWPGEGALLNRFGDTYGDGNLRRQGITIAIAQGQPVRAVNGGRIVFANWLRGYGLLIIVDHNDGYMSLYGQNQSVTREIGSWVNPGEILAITGNNSGLNQTGIYFEIRHNGRAEDPMDWLTPEFSSY